MTEEQIKDILDTQNKSEILRKMMKIYPNGFDINEIDERVKNKLEDKSKVENIQIPDKEMPVELMRKSMKLK